MQNVPLISPRKIGLSGDPEALKMSFEFARILARSFKPWLRDTREKISAPRIDSKFKRLDSPCHDPRAECGTAPCEQLPEEAVDKILLVVEHLSHPWLPTIACMEPQSLFTASPDLESPTAPGQNGDINTGRAPQQATTISLFYFQIKKNSYI